MLMKQISVIGVAATKLKKFLNILSEIWNKVFMECSCGVSWRLEKSVEYLVEPREGEGRQVQVHTKGLLRAQIKLESTDVSLKFS